MLLHRRLLELMPGDYIMRRFALLLALLPLIAVAAPPPGSQPLPEAPPPPDYGPTQPSAEPQVTIVERENTTFEEYRLNGRLYKIKVTPKVGPPYWLVDDTGEGIWKRYDGQDAGLIVPHWVILRF
jgi:hypothetical protein